jgi:DNA-binding CsgD family transcriptional regulator
MNQDLTPTEHDICELLADGLTQVEVAEKRSVSMKSINNHTANIRYKADTNSTIKALLHFRYLEKP